MWDGLQVLWWMVFMGSESSHKEMRERKPDSNILQQMCSPVPALQPPCSGDSSLGRGNGRAWERSLLVSHAPHPLSCFDLSLMLPPFSWLVKSSLHARNCEELRTEWDHHFSGSLEPSNRLIKPVSKGTLNCALRNEEEDLGSHSVEASCKKWL